MLSDFISILAFIGNVIFFIWFGTTLNAIRSHLQTCADHAERQTRLLASISITQEERIELTETVL
jgi:hypothetical protein